jgi:hypothetical protein
VRMMHPMLLALLLALPLVIVLALATAALSIPAWAIYLGLLLTVAGVAAGVRRPHRPGR